MNTSSSGWRRVAIGVVALIVLALATSWFVNGGARAADVKPPGNAASAPPVRATTAPVQERDVPLIRAGIGSVTAAQSVTVKARIDGQLDQIAFREGQDVRAGQLLARIDPRTLEAQLAQVRAAKAKDSAQLANARVDLARYTKLFAEDAATQQQLDTQKALVSQLEAALLTDDAQIRFAEVQLAFTSITAPISGRVGARLVDVGNIVHAADTTGLVVINQVDPITVVFTLPEGAFQAVNAALNSSREPLVVQAFPREGNDLLGTGKLVLLNNQIDTATGTVQLKGLFPNPQHKLWPGQFVNVRLVLGTRAKALTVPAAAVQRSQDGTFAYVVEPDGKTVQNRPIQVAQIQDGLAVIEQGLSAGQRVVVDGQYKLKPGSKIVEAARAASAPASGSPAAEVAEAEPRK